jgi:hypothetical protein
MNSDNSGGRALTGSQYTSGNNMTVENCINFCSTQTKPYIYAGVCILFLTFRCHVLNVSSSLNTPPSAVRSIFAKSLPYALLTFHRLRQCFCWHKYEHHPLFMQHGL